MSDKTYTVTDSPSVGDLVTTAGTIQSTVQQHAENLTENNGYKIIRVNMSTGRATAQKIDGTGSKLQVVRGRWGWKLANGWATPIRFAHVNSTAAPAVDPHPPVLLADEAPTFKSAARTYSYLGVDATVVQHRLTKAATTRVDVMTWESKAVGQPVEFEAGTVVVSLFTGRGHQTQKQNEIILAAGATDEQIANAVQRLFDLHATH